EAGARTAVVCKSLLGKAHTVMAEGGVAASFGNVAPDDDWETHFQDTMFGGKYLNNWRMAELHAREAPARVEELERWGAVFDRTPDRKLNQRPFGGHTYPRLVHIGDRTGLELLRTLQDKAVHSGIDVYMEYIVTRLLKAGDCVAGAFGYRRIDGGYHLWSAKAVVLATGGAGKAWRVNSNSWETTGDGHALGYDAGAELVDMEFVQFHPTGMVWPPGVIGLLVTEAVRGEGGILRNNQGERFMERYDPKRLELSTRDVVARAIYTEVREGRGSPHGGVFLDVSHLSDDHVKRKLPAMYAQFLELAGVDITKEPMEVGPTCHYFMGGVSVDPETGATTVPGLFGAGECTGGMNGANRLGGNSLSDLLVFGRRAGEATAAEAAQAAAPTLADEEVAAAAAEMDAFLEGPGEDPYDIQRDLQQTMHDLVGIFRDAESLTAALEKLGELKLRTAGARAPLPGRAWNPGWNLCRDLRNMLTVAEAVARAGLLREESRGAHSRIDFPEYDEQWGGLNIVVRKGREGMELEPRPVRMRDELAGLVDRRKAAEAGDAVEVVAE
ncbi:MAG TPA: FAD-binding protein, partial [Candidatus Polarisedimenticolia bacterium]|nr:FAD-binding protein [Candidatus Polarisedimenticolia bacterium]